MDEPKTLETLGLTMPSPAYLAGVIIFSIIGYAAYRYGKKAEEVSTKWTGVALMLYPYMVSETWMMYAVGVGLCVGLYVSRR
ncbi:MAG: hypothetical protein NTY41_09860 [Proteobacteria bacterium]|nr:hypothetical protein [Pseudomonadota bacterium]